MPASLVGPPYPHVLEEEVGNEVLLYNSENKLVATLNETASDIWRMATGEFSINEVVSRLAASYDAEPDVVSSDVKATIQELIDKELIPPVA